jgi:hypothetical protein
VEISAKVNLIGSKLVPFEFEPRRVQIDSSKLVKKREEDFAEPSQLIAMTGNLLWLACL